ncbi:hypothetical protein P7K49_016132 [Saguinus oedipus]|uniref:Uncharacterized protein n=1 Tax=Saguinus oedipus TaxID=9490 RepID=A0ABQ9VB81_SAGOE|nr:hypothetical protein P7K49_016132 [Saguinus oedipus]
MAGYRSQIWTRIQAQLGQRVRIRDSPGQSESTGSLGYRLSERVQNSARKSRPGKTNSFRENGRKRGASLGRTDTCKGPLVRSGAGPAGQGHGPASLRPKSKDLQPPSNPAPRVTRVPPPLVTAPAGSRELLHSRSPANEDPRGAAGPSQLLGFGSGVREGGFWRTSRGSQNSSASDPGRRPVLGLPQPSSEAQRANSRHFCRVSAGQEGSARKTPAALFLDALSAFPPSAHSPLQEEPTRRKEEEARQGEGPPASSAPSTESGAEARGKRWLLGVAGSELRALPLSGSRDRELAQAGDLGRPGSARQG